MIRASMGRHVAITFLALGVVGCGAATSGPGSPAPSGGQVTELSGRVVRAPVRPNEPVGQAQASSPVEGADVEVSAGSRVVAHVTTDSRGRFSVRLPAGRYAVTATFQQGGPRSTATSQVQVGSQSATVTLRLDSGIR